MRGRSRQTLLLLGLTVVSGMVDAAAYLGLGHVFVVNMTGNVVILGLALGGAADFTTAGCLVALAAFTLGTVAAGWLHGRPRPRRGVTLAAESALLAAAAAVAAREGGTPYPAVAVLGLAMGMRTASVRLGGVSDITTTVITSTLAWLGANLSVAAGGGAGRRLGAVVLLLAGAATGALLTLRAGPAVALLAAVVVQVAVTLAYVLVPGRPAGS